MKHFETIISSKTLTANIFDPLNSFQASSNRVRNFKNGECRAVSLFSSTSNTSIQNVLMRLKTQETSRQSFGIEYNIESDTYILDIYDRSLYLIPNELINVEVNSSSPDFIASYLSVYYDDANDVRFNRFISNIDFQTQRKIKVTKATSSITLNTTGNPNFIALSSILSGFNGSSYYALLGAMSNHYVYGFQAEVYAMILTGKFSNNNFVSFPMNGNDIGFDHSSNYFQTMALRLGISCIPVIKGEEFSSTFLDMYGSGVGGETCLATFHFCELPNYAE